MMMMIRSLLFPSNFCRPSSEFLEIDDVFIQRSSSFIITITIIIVGWWRRGW